MANDIIYFAIARSPEEIAAGKPNTYVKDGVIVPELPANHEFVPSDPSKYTDIFKFSGSAPITLTGVKSAQGREDSVDMNRFVNGVNLHGDFGLGNVKGNAAFTIKGGSHDINVTGVVHSRGKQTDVDIGNWSDQTYDESYNIYVDLTHIDGKPIRVRIGRAYNVTLGPNCKHDIIGSILLKCYWWTKWLVRKILKIKVGESGPSWL